MPTETMSGKERSGASVKTVPKEDIAGVDISKYFPSVSTQNIYAILDGTTGSNITETFIEAEEINNVKERAVESRTKISGEHKGTTTDYYTVSQTKIAERDGYIIIKNAPAWESQGLDFYITDTDKTVEVYSGLYDDCIEVSRIDPDTGFRAVFTYAPKVGLLKMSKVTKDEEDVIVELYYTKTLVQEDEKKETKESDESEANESNTASVTDENDYDQLFKMYYEDKENFIGMLEDGMNPNAESDGTSILFNFSFSGDIEAVELLLEYGADPNSTNSYNTTAVSIAATKGHTSVVRALLEAGADPNLKDDGGMSALSEELIGTEIGDLLGDAGAVLY
ncbi:hypothetical protein GCM10007216_19780 [Thalassobacillus devorans]|uniref:Ankyrin repeat protein n=1 Tax=Thalassobacillus devorans TaxID=279813 RepID=A0ABQ1P162_9BACI|nr:hypothetical protein GCM10007216_19780 [Thalassobacillus devorans]